MLVSEKASCSMFIRPKASRQPRYKTRANVVFKTVGLCYYAKIKSKTVNRG
jgi:hypothetical protein